MADEKLSANTNEITTPTDTDRLYIVDDIGGTPVSGFLSWSNLKATVKTYLDTLYATLGANSDITSLTGLTSMGALPARTPVTDSAANFAANFTGADLYGGTFVCNSAGTCQLPEMAAGMNFTIITLGDIEVVVDTNAADGYLMDGVTNAEGKNLTNLSSSGDMAVFQYYTADDWLITTNGWTPEA